MTLDMNGIKNENEFFTTHYIAAMLEGDLDPLVRSWKEEAETTAHPTPARLLQEWGRRWLKRDRSGAATEENLLPELLEILGYEPALAMLPLGAGSLRAEAEVRRASGVPELWVLAVKDKGDGQCDPLECPLYLADEQGQPLPDAAAPPRGGCVEQPHICGGGAAAFRPAVLLPTMRAGRPVQMECPPPAAFSL